jgi:hypothetical protein
MVLKRDNYRKKDDINKEEGQEERKITRKNGRKKIEGIREKERLR